MVHLSRLWARVSPYWIAAFFLLLLSTLYHRVPGSSGFPLDDGYISLHSAQVLHWGTDPNFPGVPALAGITNAPYVLLLWALLFFLPPLVALQAACWLGILCYATGVVALCRSFQLKWPASLAVIFLAAAAGNTCYQLLNGVETGFALGLCTWAVASAIRNSRWSRRLAALLCGLGPFLRPEFVVLSALILFHVLRNEWSDPKAGAERVQGCVYLLLFAAFSAMPWLAWYGLSTGSVVPLSIEAKQFFFAEGCAPSLYRWNVVVAGVRAFVVVIGVFALSVLFLWRSTLGRYGIVFIVVFFYAYYERLPGALFHNYARYVYALLPILLLGMTCALADRSRLVRNSAYLLLLASCFQSAWNLPQRWRLFVRDRDSYTAALQSVAAWSNHHLPPTAKLLIHDAGYISNATRFQMVDLVGLKTPSSIEINRKYTYAACGLGRAFAIEQIAHSAEPDYLVTAGDWDRIFQISAGLRMLKWQPEKVFENGNYRIYRLTAPPEAAPLGAVIDNSKPQLSAR